MQKVNCPTCNAQIGDSKYTSIYFSKLSNKEYKLYYCLNCGTKFWYPMKIIREVYEDDAITSYLMWHLDIKDELTKIRVLPFLKKFPLRKGKLLDIGCGNGEFLEHAKKLGFKIWGIDLDRKSIEVAKKRGLENLYPLFLEEFINIAKEKKLKFDVITFFAVFEHQDNPKKFIKQVKELLKEGGWIAGCVPNGERKVAKIQHKLYDWDYPPHHFTWWSRDALKIFFKMNGFKINIYDDEYFTTEDLVVLIESWLLGGISKLARRMLRRGIVKKGVSQEVRFANLSTQDLEKLNIKDLERLDILSRKKHIIKFLAIIRSVIFGPLAIFLKPYFNSTGKSLYFQGYLKV